MHRVVMPFPFSWDGIHAVDLAIGDERDFGPMAAGLIGMGWIEPVVAAAAPTDEPPLEMAVAVDGPLEMAVEKPRRGKRK